jgi:predicted RNA-binding Zn ribbon-like protein
MSRQSLVVYKFIAGNLALDFANTVHNAGLPKLLDELKTIDDLLDWAQRAGLLSARDSTHLARRFKSNRPYAGRTFARALRLRNAIYRLFSCLAQTGRNDEKALAQFNGWLRTAMSHVRIASLDQRAAQVRKGTGLAFGWEASSSTVPNRMLWEITHSAADLLVSDDLKKVRQCNDDFCSWLFVDTSRNGRRRWCSMQLCGNRARVRDYRSRQSA